MESCSRYCLIGSHSGYLQINFRKEPEPPAGITIYRVPLKMERQKEISQRHYYNRKNNGLCPRCGKPRDREGHYCSECLVKVRRYHKENRNFYVENHLCTECGKVEVPGSEHICPECRAKRENHRKPLTQEQKIRYTKKFNEQRKLLYQQRSEQGICTRCGKRKVMSGKKKCGICLEKDAEMRRMKRIEQPNIREYRKTNHLCYFCGSPVDMESGNICKRCYEICRINGTKGGAKNSFWKNDNRLIFNNAKEGNNYESSRTTQAKEGRSKITG